MQISTVKSSKYKQNRKVTVTQKLLKPNDGIPVSQDQWAHYVQQ